MMDIIEELDHWLADQDRAGISPPSHGVIQHARDEIVALRRNDADTVLLSDAWLMAHTARAEALEEAARECENLAKRGFQYPMQVDETMCAAAIRALKEKK